MAPEPHMDKIYINIGPFIILFDAINHVIYICLHNKNTVFYKADEQNSAQQTSNNFP